MEKKYVKFAIEGLKSTSRSRVQESLQKIRSKIITSTNGIQLFRDCRGIEHLLPHLRKPNEKILDLTLSILGNCCLDEECSAKVGNSGSLPQFVAIINTVSKDSIVGRTCRVIGNLAQREQNADGLHSCGAVTVLVKLIESRNKNTSYPTLSMAVRAIRQLWMITDKREEMLSLNAVHCVTMLLITECESAGFIKCTNLNKERDDLRPSQEELINGILKCLGYFTTHMTTQCAEQIQGDGRGYQCLVALTKTHESLALKCLMNLCYLSTCRPILGASGTVECLVGVLQKHSEVSMWPEGAARALAQLSEESVNRSRLRYSGGLPLLLLAARDSQHAMRALLQYVFDESLFQILVDGGLINLLTDELIKYITTMKFEHNIMENRELSNKLMNIKNITKESNIKSAAYVTSELTQFNREETMSSKEIKNVTKSKKDQDELKVTIERDNMIVGFVDAVDSDASDDSQFDSDYISRKRADLKRPRLSSPKCAKKRPQLIRMPSKDWSASVYWEPKTPEWPSTSQRTILGGATSPGRLDHCMLQPYSDDAQLGSSPEHLDLSSKKPWWDRSPESGYITTDGSLTSPSWTEYQSSPRSSDGPSSPFSSINEESSDSEVSGRYSPVCSEAEGEAESEAVDLAVRNSTMAEVVAVQVANDLDELIMEDNDSTDEGMPSEESLKRIETNPKSSRVACVLILLFRVSHATGAGERVLRCEEPASNNALELLASSECLNALLDYVHMCKRPLGRAARVLTKVLSNATCLMSVLRHRIALRLYNMTVNSKHPPPQCSQCKQIMKLSTKLLTELTILTESSYGIGEISYQLLKGTSAMKQTLSLTLPYLVRAEKPLKKYLLECGTLNSLFEIMADNREDLKDCVTALSKLASNVHIKDPKTLENRFKDQVCVSYDPILDNLSADDIVTFELDDMSTVKANKLFLCQNSEVFSAMLMGRFKESVEKCVQLKNITKPALEYLLTLLHFGLDNPKQNVEIFPMAEDLETNLEVLLLSDRFLFEKLKGLLCSAILQFQMKPEGADKVYVWSLNKGMGFLCVESVAYLLTGQMCDSERTRAFRNILNLEYREQFLDDIKSMILRQLVK